MSPQSKPPNSTDTILDNLLDAVLLVDKKGMIIYANKSALQLFEKTASELLDHPFGFPLMRYEVQEINMVKGGELLTVQMLASSIEWNGSTVSLLSLRDITAQKKLIEELEEQKSLLEKMNEENAQYASLASHDLKEPVRKILFYSSLLLRSDGKPSGDMEKLNKIRSSAAKMDRLINGIAELSRVSYVEHPFERLNLKEVVEEVCEDLEFQLQEKGGVVMTGPLPEIDAVPEKMYQLFLNLISNSLKYAREGVKPVIRITSKPVENGLVEIFLQDNGIGFENAMADQLFQPFRRLHTRKYEGVGIGLSLCQRIMEIHGGTISAEGIDGEGATFKLVLPVRQPRNSE